MVEIGLWESVIIVSVFSVVVIVADEIIHARARKRRAAQRGQQAGH
jgi:hypothetical protein